MSQKRKRTNPPNSWDCGNNSITSVTGCFRVWYSHNGQIWDQYTILFPGFLLCYLFDLLPIMFGLSSWLINGLLADYYYFYYSMYWYVLIWLVKVCIVNNNDKMKSLTFWSHNLRGLSYLHQPVTTHIWPMGLSSRMRKHGP